MGPMGSGKGVCRMRGQDGARGPGSGIEGVDLGVQLDKGRLEPWHGARYWTGTRWDRDALCVTGMGPTPAAEWNTRAGLQHPMRRDYAPRKGTGRPRWVLGWEHAVPGAARVGRAGVPQWTGEGPTGEPCGEARWCWEDKHCPEPTPSTPAPSP